MPGLGARTEHRRHHPSAVGLDPGAAGTGRRGDRGAAGRPPRRACGARFPGAGARRPRRSHEEAYSAQRLVSRLDSPCASPATRNYGSSPSSTRTRRRPPSSPRYSASWPRHPGFCGRRSAATQARGRTPPRPPGPRPCSRTATRSSPAYPRRATCSRACSRTQRSRSVSRWRCCRRVVRGRGFRRVTRNRVQRGGGGGGGGAARASLSRARRR